MKRLLTVMTVMGAVLITACGSGGSPASGGSAAGGTSSAVATTYTVGQAMKASDGRTVTVISFKRNFDSGNQFEVPATGNKYVQVTYALSNGSNQEWTLPLFELGLIDANGQKHNSGFVGGQGNVDSLVAGGKAPSVSQVYEVPKDSAVDVAWTPNIFENTVLQTALK